MYPDPAVTLRVRFRSWRAYWASESRLARMNVAVIGAVIIKELAERNERTHETADLSRLLLAAALHHHCLSGLALVRSALFYDSVVCLRSAVETLFLFAYFVKEPEETEAWFYRQKQLSPGSVRKETSLPTAFSDLYREMCDYTHPNLLGTFAFFRREAPQEYRLFVGTPSEFPRHTLPRIVNLIADEFLAQVYSYVQPRHPGLISWLRKRNASHCALPLLLPAH